ncbi:MAG: NUDIX domain-containing protein [Luteitalea sp.]|nr:NUDIX domain-containing protein [Luteitalea sp.]
MPKLSAGLLMFHERDGDLEVLLVHPGGPFFRNKDAGAWTIPKGEPDEGEDLLEAARREFQEEIGVTLEGPFLPLTPVKQKGGKIVHAWAVRGDCNTFAIKPNTFTLEWPPGSGRTREFPEIDYAAFFPLDEARQKINSAQVAFLDELTSLDDR